MAFLSLIDTAGEVVGPAEYWKTGARPAAYLIRTIFLTERVPPDANLAK